MDALRAEMLRASGFCDNVNKSGALFPISAQFKRKKSHENDPIFCTGSVCCAFFRSVAVNHIITGRSLVDGRTEKIGQLLISMSRGHDWATGYCRF